MQNIEPSWLPPQPHLHYQSLYRGIYEWLRAPPSYVYHERAAEYLSALLTCYYPANVLQYHRIQWTTAWLNALVQDGYGSDADTVVGASDNEI